MTAHKGMSKDLRALAALAAAHGWTVSATRSGHYKWTSPTGAPVYSAGTPSDRRSQANLRALLRRHGLAA